MEHVDDLSCYSNALEITLHKAQAGNFINSIRAYLGCLDILEKVPIQRDEFVTDLGIERAFDNLLLFAKAHNLIHQAEYENFCAVELTPTIIRILLWQLHDSTKLRGDNYLKEEIIVFDEWNYDPKCGELNFSDSRKIKLPLKLNRIFLKLLSEHDSVLSADILDPTVGDMKLKKHRISESIHRLQHFLFSVSDILTVEQIYGRGYILKLKKSQSIRTSR